MAHHRSTFGLQEREIGNQTFTQCAFYKCTLVYSGGTIPVFQECEFQDCTVKVVSGDATIGAQILAAIQNGTRR